MPSDEATIPQWAANLQASVARIEGQVAQIPDVVKELKEVRANTVPMQEHLKLMNDVDMLKNQNLGEQSDWEEMKVRMPVLWERHIQTQGALRFIRAWVAAITFAVLLLGFLITVHNAGIHIST